jgi:hypothetical protein
MGPKGSDKLQVDVNVNLIHLRQRTDKFQVFLLKCGGFELVCRPAVGGSVSDSLSVVTSSSIYQIRTHITLALYSNT